MLIESSTVMPWSPPLLWSFSVRPRHGRIRACRAVDEVAAVELGADLDGQVAVPQRLRRCRLGVGRGQDEVAAHADEHLDVAARHRRDARDGVEPVLARRVDAADLGQPVEELLGRTVVDAAGAVALDVAVPADRATGRRPRGRCCRAAAAG